MARGDHIYVRRRLGLYTHHGIDCGDGSVIHFAGEPGRGKKDAHISRTEMDVFLAGSKVRLVEYGERDAPEVAVARAESRLGDSGYHLAFNNCEHFAAWCCTGREESHQARGWWSTAANGAVFGVTAGSASGVVSAVGVTKGLSGAGIMSGLARLGGVVGGGAAAGPAVLGAIPTATTLGVIRIALRDDESLPEADRSARRDGRHASVVGAVTATVGGTAAIYVAGTTGMSAVGISTGLATVGGVFGGMVAGTVVVAAAPAVAAGAAAVGVYAVSRSVRRRRVRHRQDSTGTQVEIEEFGLDSDIMDAGSGCVQPWCIPANEVGGSRPQTLR